MPEVDNLTPGHRPIAGILFCVFALLLFALQDSIIKGLSQQYPLLQVLSFRSSIVLALLAGCIFSVALLCITQAYRIAIVSSVAPFEYSYLLWASIIGYLLFGDIPGLRTILGGSVVVLCGCYIIYRERGRQSN